MIAFHTMLLLMATFLATFAQAIFAFPRNVLGVQADLLPPLVVYAALQTNLTGLSMLALCGGLCFDSLSANPLGITILPLFLVGLPLHVRRELILRDQPFAQFVLGTTAGALIPTLTLLLLLSLGHSPLLGWGSLWQLAVLSVTSGAMTPLVFVLFGACDRTLSYRSRTQSSFRPDRDIRRGRT